MEPSLDPVDIRWKMAVACDVCRRRKVRCDGERPCSRCQKSQRECTFSLPRHVARRTQDPGPSKRERASSGSQENLPQPKRRSSSKSPTDGRPRSGHSGSGDPQVASIHSPPTKPPKDHLLLVDPDDQIVYSGPSSGMPLFARLGLLRTVEVSEGLQEDSQSTSHSAAAIGLTSASSPSRDYFDMCLQRCPQELMNTVFFPLLHAPSFLSEFIAVTERRLKCTPQYGAFLMSILAVTARLVEGGRALVPAADRAGEVYYEFAQDLLRVSKNKLDIRHILALYHLALFAEGRSSSAGIASSFLAEAIGLAFATGLHRGTDDFRMDPVTLQIRTRLFWALYSLDVALAYSQGRPALLRLSECSIELPAVVDNGMITKTEILPQPIDSPPVIMAAAVKMIDLHIILEQVLSAINAPLITISQRFDLGFISRRRSERLARAEMFLDEIESSLPSYLTRIALPASPSDNLEFLQSSRIRATLLFVRTLVARQALIDEFEATPPPADHPSDTTLAACALSVDIITTYSRLRHVGFLQYCSFNAVSHLTAASHTLIACMIRNNNLVFEHRPDLLSAIDMLIIFSTRFPSAETVAHQLVQLSRSLDYNTSSAGANSSEALAIRVLARKMAVSPAAGGPPSPHPTSIRPITPNGEHHPTTQSEQFDYDWLVKTALDTSVAPPIPPRRHSQDRNLPIPNLGPDTPRGLSPLDHGMTFGASLSPRPNGQSLSADWSNFSFLNDGLFGAL
ncbi:hypothetical protein IAT40_001976 [Kwoniella sp. CBS 6097]